MKPTNEWSLDHKVTGTIYVESSPARDSNGRVWNDMAHRVLSNGKVVKTFVSETAWADADRHAMDLALAETYGTNR